jgi:hypothetical protein
MGGRPNKRMQLTKLRAAPVLQAEVPPCAPADTTDGGTASQLIRSVGWTNSRDREGNDTPAKGQGQPGRSPAEDARCSSWAFPTVQPPKPATHARKTATPRA